MTIDAFVVNPQEYEAVGITEEETAIGKEEVVLDEEPIVENIKVRRLGMADEKIPGIMRDFSRALEAKNTERVLSFFADEGSWITPEGAFKGKDEIRRFVKWQFDQVHDIKITEHGNGIIAQGNTAFYEHMIAGTMRGVKGEYLALSAWEFKDDKVKALRTVNDRLSFARQVARGWLAKWLVSLVANQAEKGLR